MNIRGIDFSSAIDWVSVKLTGLTVIFAAITWSKITGIGGLLVMASTFVYNGIRIYKELKNKNKNGTE